MIMRRVVRDRRLAPEEAEKYSAVRKQVEAELPELVARHHCRLEAMENLEALFPQLRAARERTRA